jgi:YbgC/YbaW family acyl-CoA thioester hydrolase
MSAFIARRRVEFSDTDMGGVVHFSRYFVYMETAEHEFLRARGIEIDSQVDGRRISWPRVAARCEYRRPARYGDELQIGVQVARRGRTSVSYSFTIRRGDEELALGEATAVCCALEPDGSFAAVAIPAAMVACLDGEAR